MRYRGSASAEVSDLHDGSSITPLQGSSAPFHAPAYSDIPESASLHAFIELPASVHVGALLLIRERKGRVRTRVISVHLDHLLRRMFRKIPGLVLTGKPCNSFQQEQILIPLAVGWLQFGRRISMLTDPATAIKREVLLLVELQIETLRREGRLTECDPNSIARVLGGSPVFTRNSIGSEGLGSSGNLSEPRRLTSV